MIIYNEKDKKVRDRAIEAMRDKKIADKRLQVEKLNKYFLKLKQDFPDLEMDVENFCFKIAGYSFEPYRGYLDDIFVGLIPKESWTRFGRVVWNMTDLGEYILYRENCEDPPKALAQ